MLTSVSKGQTLKMSDGKCRFWQNHLNSNSWLQSLWKSKAKSWRCGFWPGHIPGEIFSCKSWNLNGHRETSEWMKLVSGVCVCVCAGRERPASTPGKERPPKWTFAESVEQMWKWNCMEGLLWLKQMSRSKLNEKPSGLWTVDVVDMAPVLSQGQ